MLLDPYFQQHIEWTKFAVGSLYNVKVKKKCLVSTPTAPGTRYFRPEVTSRQALCSFALEFMWTAHNF